MQTVSGTKGVGANGHDGNGGYAAEKSTWATKKGLAQMLKNGVIQRLIALLFAYLNHAGDLMRFRFAHEIGDSHVYHQNLERGHATRSIDAFEKILRNDPFERFSQGGADLVLLIGWENVDDSINCFGRAGSM